MSRDLTANTEAEAATYLATEPIVIIQIDWSTGTQYYGDKTFTLDAANVQGKVISFSPINYTGKQDTRGEVSSVSLDLDDTDGTLKTLVNTVIIESTPVTVYHHYEGNAFSDLATLMKGKVSGTIRWSEGERLLSFDIESYIDDAEVGYEDDDGLVYPLCFGTAVHVPAAAAVKSPYGTNNEAIYGGYPSLEVDPFQVANGSTFEQGVVMDIVVAGTIFTGYFNGDTFHRSQSN